MFGPPDVDKLVTKRDVRGLIKALTYKDPTIRFRAAAALGDIGGAEGVPALCTALKDQDKDVRNWAAVSLGRLTDRRAVLPLCDALLDDVEETVRVPAAAALGSIGDRIAIGALVLALRDANESVRSRAAGAIGQILGHDALAEIEAGRAAEHVLESLGGANGSEQRISVALWLGAAVESPGALIDVLAKGLQHPDKDVRAWCVEGLGPNDVFRADLPLRVRAVQLLIDALTDAPVRTQAIVALASWKDPRAVQPLTSVLRGEDELDSGLAAAALKAIGGPEAIQAVVEFESRSK